MKCRTGPVRYHRGQRSSAFPPRSERRRVVPPPAKNSHPKHTMASTTKIGKYCVFYSTGSFAPRIGLYAAGKLIGQLNFMEDGSTLPTDGPIHGTPWLYYHKQDFANVIDLLRNEQPAYLYYNGTGPSHENGIKNETPIVTLRKAAAAARPRRAR